MKKTDYPFGAVYLIEEGRPFDEMERDLDRMRGMGYDLLTVWPVANSWLAARPDEFRFDDTRRLLDAIHRRGMKAVLQLIGQNPSQEYMPDCLMRPEMLVQEPGLNRERAAWANCFWPNPNHPDVDAAIRRYLREAILALRDHPALFAWDLFNEAHLRTDDPWTVALYRDWLRAKYGTIEALNRRWYRRYGSFADINPVDRNAPYSVWSSILPSIEYDQFRSENLTALCRRWVGYAREHDGAHPMMVDGSAWQLLSTTEFTTRNNDEFATAEVCDLFGGTYYPRSWGRNFTGQPWGLALSYLGTWSAARAAGKPFYVNELQTHTQSALTPGSEVSPRELAAWIWTAIACGAQGIQLWRQRPFLHGAQSTGRGLTRLDGTPGPRAEAVAGVVATLRRHEQRITGARPVPPTARLLVGYRTRLMTDFFLGGRSDVSQADALKGWYRLFWQIGVPADVGDLARLGADDARVPILVLPSVISLSDAQAEWLAAYVRDGGTLIADARLNALDDWGVVRAEGPPGRVLQPVFGCREVDVGGACEFLLGGAAVRAGFLSQHVECDPGTEVVARAGDGRPMVTQRRHGKGRALYVAAVAGPAWQQDMPPTLRAWFRTFILGAAPSTFFVDSDGPVHAALHADGPARLAYLVSFAERDVTAVLHGLGAAAEARELTAESRVAVSDGQATVVVPPYAARLVTWGGA